MSELIRLMTEPLPPKATELKREELLTVLKNAFTDARHELHRCQYPLDHHKERMDVLNQAERKIKALIQKPGVAEEWIEEKAIELNNEILLESHKGNYFEMAKDFIRSLVEESASKDWDNARDKY